MRRVRPTGNLHTLFTSLSGEIRLATTHETNETNRTTSATILALFIQTKI